ncbi:MAG: helix-turn-helix transcriptional regulator [archaeon]|nr:helix-turn-helix transcriptional regulator [archaeon]MCP8317700.1 helix-turn-helix transcriptional regulator [archaeon]MCP8320684.1 helix-turn-helix transcriptional regulator [archaeon]
MELAKSIEDEASLKLEANFFKALADVTRLRIMKMLSVREMCVCEIMIALNMSQPNASHHLEMLERVGIVKKRKEGKWVFYSLAKPEMVNLLNKLSAKSNLL